MEIDNRELLLKQYFVKTYQNTDTIQYSNLDLGDIVFKINNNPVLIIERKTVSDLAASIKDGRHREQKIRLLHSDIPVDRILYIIEGNLDNIVKVNGMSINILISSIINTLLRDNIKVYKTINIDETIQFIDTLYKKVLSNKIDLSIVLIPTIPTIEPNIDHNINNHVNYAHTIKLRKKENLTPEICFILQLAQIPGVSQAISNVIYEKYKSMNTLCITYNDIQLETERLKLLCNLTYPITNDKTRKVGPVISGRIYKYIYGITDI